MLVWHWKKGLSNKPMCLRRPDTISCLVGVQHYFPKQTSLEDNLWSLRNLTVEKKTPFNIITTISFFSIILLAIPLVLLQEKQHSFNLFLYVKRAKKRIIGIGSKNSLSIWILIFKFDAIPWILVVFSNNTLHSINPFEGSKGSSVFEQRMKKDRQAKTLYDSKNFPHKVCN